MDEPLITPAPEGPTLAHIAARVLNCPLLLHPTKAEIVLEVLAGRIGIEAANHSLPADASRFLGRAVGEDGNRRVYRLSNGVAIIPIIGSLVNRGRWIGTSSGLVSYEGITAQLKAAESDPEVSAVILDIDSPGGEAGGMFGVAERIKRLDQIKPVIAVVDDMAASAAYGIASAAREIIVSQTSDVGSIGVVLTHVDRSGEMEKKGWNATLIHAGQHKVDGHPFGPLSDTVRADLQAKVDSLYNGFVSLVAGNRSALTKDEVKDTEARVFSGQDAIDRGLADRFASVDVILSEFQPKALGAAKRKGGFAMSEPTNAGAPQAENAGITEAQMATAVDTARAEGRTEATTRIKTILENEEAQGREAQARVLALDTDMNAVQAVKVLAASPKLSGASDIGTRASGMAEFGDEGQAPKGSVETAASIWGPAVKNANESIGVKA